MVAASGPSLTESVASACLGELVVAVNDAYRLLPFAKVLYACDAEWWTVHEGCHGFAGERWSSHSPGTNDKAAAAAKWGLRLVRGRDQEGFSFDPSAIHYGSNSGFQAVNLALLFGAITIVLVGFDMHSKHGRHFFGEHPPVLNKIATYESFIPYFERAAATLPAGIRIMNCTPGSALRSFPMMDLEEALRVSDERPAPVSA